MGTFAVILSIITTLLINSSELKELFIMILALFCIGIVYISIIIPINFKVSVEKLRIIMFALFFFPVSIIGIFAEKIIRNLDSIISYIKEFYWNLPIVIIVALAISIYTSINILNKKEY